MTEKHFDKKRCMARRARLLALCFCVFGSAALILGLLALRESRRAACTLTLNYEQAAFGLAPDGSRYTVSQLKTEAVLCEALSTLGLDGSAASELAGCIEISPAKNEITRARSMTRYDITLKKPGFGTVSTSEALGAVMDSYSQYFVAQYLASPAAPEIDWNEAGALEYSEQGVFLQNACARLTRYVRGERELYGGNAAAQNGESFASLERRAANIQNVDIERYDSFIVETGLAKSPERLSYALSERELLAALTGTESSAGDARRGETLLAGLATQSSASNTEKAGQMFAGIKLALDDISAEAAALHEQAAAKRAGMALTVEYAQNKASALLYVCLGAAAAAAVCGVLFYAAKRTGKGGAAQ